MAFIKFRPTRHHLKRLHPDSWTEVDVWEDNERRFFPEATCYDDNRASPVPRWESFMLAEAAEIRREVALFGPRYEHRAAAIAEARETIRRASEHGRAFACSGGAR